MQEVLYDLSGQRFGRLTALEFDYYDKWKANAWKCLCDCGQITWVYGWHLRNGKILSCGCHSRDVTSERTSTHGITKTGKTHPLWKEYCRWQRARRRHGATETFEEHQRRELAAEPSASNADTADTEE